MIRVLIAADYPVVRSGLKEILSRQRDIAVLGEARTVGEAHQLVVGQSWDVVVIDLSLPDGGGLEVVKAIRQERAKLPILVLSLHPEEFAVRALRAGATGYISKKAEPDELVAAVRQLAQGRRYVNAVVAEELIGALGHGSDLPPHQRLSDREFQVLILLGSGRSVSEVARELGLSVKTISTYRARILEKMEIQSNAQLVHYVLQRHLAEPV